MRAQAEKYFPESAPRNHVIHNGLSRQLLAAAERTDAPWSGRPHLIAIQSNQPYKNNSTLLKTLTLLIENAPELHWELTILGNDDWSSLHPVVAELGLSEACPLSGLSFT